MSVCCLRNQHYFLRICPVCCCEYKYQRYIMRISSRCIFSPCIMQISCRKWVQLWVLTPLTRCCLSVASGVSTDRLSVGLCVWAAVWLSLSKEEQTLHNSCCRCQESAASRPILIKENVILLHFFVISQQFHAGSNKMQEKLLGGVLGNRQTYH